MYSPSVPVWWMHANRVVQLYTALSVLFVLALGWFALRRTGKLAGMADLRYSRNVVYSPYNDRFVFRALHWPKSYFAHFYVLGLLMCAACMYVAVNMYVNGIAIPEQFADYLRVLAGVERGRSSISPAVTLLLLGLICLHCARRAYESLFVSVYSPTHMHLAHYLLGCAHYMFLPVVVVIEAIGFAPKTSSGTLLTGETAVTQLWHVRVLAAVLLFIFASAMHHSCITRLARLRKLPDGTIATLAHGIVYDHWWFTKTSCPHFLFEILMYASLALLGGSAHRALCAQFAFVCTNQILASLATHEWYTLTFPQHAHRPSARYPLDRRALIPYIF